MAIHEMIQAAWKAWWESIYATEQEKWSRAIDAAMRATRKPLPPEGDKGFLKIEICFPCPVELTQQDQIALDEIVTAICARYEKDHPARVMWPFGIGYKPTYIPMTAEEEATRGMEFDDTTFEISCSEREDYDF